MLPRSVPSYKVFYQDADGLLHTKFDSSTVAVGGRLMCESGIHFCVTVEDCLTYHEEKTWEGKRRVVAQVTPQGDECMFAFDKYCALGVEVVRLLEEEEKPCLAAAIAAAGADPASDGSFVILWASRNGYTGVVRDLLVDPRVDPCVKDNDAIRRASRKDHDEVALLLLADPRVRLALGADDNCAIRFAFENGHDEVLLLLLAGSCAAPGACDDASDYAIRWASQYGHVDVVRVLLTDPIA